MNLFALTLPCLSTGKIPFYKIWIERLYPVLNNVFKFDLSCVWQIATVSFYLLGKLNYDYLKVIVPNELHDKFWLRFWILSNIFYDPRASCTKTAIISINLDWKKYHIEYSKFVSVEVAILLLSIFTKVVFENDIFLLIDKRHLILRIDTKYFTENVFDGIYLMPYLNLTSAFLPRPSE